MSIEVNNRASSESGQFIRYVIITPVRDEERHIRHTLESVVGQSIRPAQWIIVDDGSTDRTREIVETYTRDHAWIRLVKRDNRGFRSPGGGVMEAFYDGFKLVEGGEWDFIIKLDGDLTFRPDYFEECFRRFRDNATLGIGGGAVCHDVGGVTKVEECPRFHVRGATKIYRRQCWEAIGGLWRGPGWDTIDEVRANMLGWQTATFPELQLLHHRFTGSANGFFRDTVTHGKICYITGYHPLFLLASCVRRIPQRPFLLGSVAILYGFIRGYLTRPPRIQDRGTIRFVRHQQLRRLCGLSTIWK